MSFGEMIITLDDVTSLLHILVTRDLFTLASVTQEGSIVVLVDQLQVTKDEAYDEIDLNNGD